MSAVGVATSLFVFWLVLTWSVAPLDLAIGALVSAALGVWAARFLWPGGSSYPAVYRLPRFVGYVIHLLGSVVAAAVHVAEVVLDPRLPVHPTIITHRTTLRSDAARVAFANSVTVTPGTLTVDVDDDTFFVHCLDERFADEIASGELEHRIARVFEE